MTPPCLTQKNVPKAQLAAVIRSQTKPAEGEYVRPDDHNFNKGANKNVPKYYHYCFVFKWTDGLKYFQKVQLDEELWQVVWLRRNYNEKTLTGTASFHMPSTSVWHVYCFHLFCNWENIVYLFLENVLPGAICLHCNVIQFVFYDSTYIRSFWFMDF